MRWHRWIIAAAAVLAGCHRASEPTAPTTKPAKPVDVALEKGRLVDFQTIGFADNDAFDAILEGTLQGHPARVALVTEVPFDGVRAPDFPPRINAWIDLWAQANPVRGIAWVKVVLKGSKGISLITIDLGGLDPANSIRAAGEMIAEWARTFAGAASRWVQDARRRQARERKLEGYHLSLVSIHGKAALLLTTDPIASIVERASRPTR